VFVVGHDWGAIVAWQLCLLRPDLVRAHVNLSVAYHPRGPERRPLQAIKALCGEDHYICVFQVRIGTATSAVLFTRQQISCVRELMLLSEGIIIGGSSILIKIGSCLQLVQKLINNNI
jgi:pimeloyl-ACP methyl ester carboxylesterase